MIIMRVQGDNVQENIDYLKYNGYGKVVFKLTSDLYVGFLGTRKFLELGDVSVLKVYQTMLGNYTSQSEFDYLEDIA